jgi:hypothetical protein
MMDWTDGRPNARFWVLKLLHDNFGPGDKQVEVDAASNPLVPDNPYLYSLAFATRDGKHRILLVNKRDRKCDITISGIVGGRMDYVDQTTSFQPPATTALNSETFSLGGYSVAVITLP